MKPTRPLTGLVAALHTPFRPDGSLCLEAVEAQAARLRAHGIDLALASGPLAELRARLESLGFFDWIRGRALR